MSYEILCVPVFPAQAGIQYLCTTDLHGPLDSSLRWNDFCSGSMVSLIPTWVKHRDGGFPIKLGMTGKRRTSSAERIQSFASFCKAVEDASHSFIIQLGLGQDKGTHAPKVNIDIVVVVFVTADCVEYDAAFTFVIL